MGIERTTSRDKRNQSHNEKQGIICLHTDGSHLLNLNRWQGCSHSVSAIQLYEPWKGLEYTTLKYGA